jgi:Peptidase C13 family
MPSTGMTEAGAMKAVLAQYLRNIAATYGGLMGSPMPPGAIQAGPVQIVLAMLTGMLPHAVFHAFAQWPVTGVSDWGVQWFFAAIFVALASLTLGAVLVGRGAAAGQLIVSFYLVMPISVLITAGLFHFRGRAETWPAYWEQIALMLLPQIAVILSRLTTRGSLLNLTRGLPVAALYGAAMIASAQYLPQDWMFTTVETEDYADYEPVDIEQLYTGQDALIAAQIAALTPQNPARIDLYALSVAGTASQSVFLREVDQVGVLLADRFGADGHMIALANSEDDPFRLPLANKANIARGLSALAARMDKDQDIALIFLTSHGGPDVFSLSFYEAGTTDLSASELKEMLDGSGLKNLILVISACKSGSFIDDLTGPDRLIVTAASATRNSFGCGDNIDWTWWGDAYFNHALRQTHDFRAAYGMASKLITAWEWSHWKRSSHPQISEGGRIGTVIDAWLAEEPDRKMAAVD